MKAEKVELPTLGSSVIAVRLAVGVAEKHNAQKPFVTFWLCWKDHRKGRT